MLKKLSSNILIYGGTNAIKSLVPFLMLPILTTYLSTHDYGVLSLVEVSILFLAPFITLNINSAINVEYFKLSHSELKIYISNALLLSLLMGVILVSIALFLKYPLSNALKLEESIILWLPIFAFLRVVSSVVLGVYQVSEKPMKFAMYTLMQTAIDFTLSYVLVVFVKNGYIGRLEGIYGAFFIASIYGLVILYRSNYIANFFNWKYTKEILNYGVPLIPHVIGGVVLAMSDRYFISYYKGNDIVGLYTVAYQIGAIMLLASVSINQAWMPMLFRMLADYQKYKKQIQNYTFYLFLLYTLLGIVLYFMSDILFSFLIDKKFCDAKLFFPALLLGFVFQSYYYLFTNVLFFQKKTKLLAKLTFFSAILNLILNYFLIHKFGAIGVAYATAITWIIYCIIIVFTSLKLYNRRMI